MTDEELLARLLYRDGMMLVIDKAAGIAVHRGPKGGENLEEYFHALRFACRATLPWRIGSIAIPPAAWCSGATTRRSKSSAFCSSRAKSKRSIGPSL